MFYSTRGKHILRIILEKFSRLRRNNLFHFKKLLCFHYGLKKKVSFFACRENRFVPNVLVLCSITSFCAQQHRFVPNDTVLCTLI